MEEKKIILNYDRSHFLEIYSKNGGMNLFSKDLLFKLTGFIFSLFIFSTSFMFYFNSSENNYFIFVIFTSLFVISSGYYFLKGIIQKLKSMDEINKYLNKLDKIQLFSISLLEHSLIVFENKKETVFNISKINYVEIYEQYLLIDYHNQFILLPTKSLLKSDYLFLQDWLRKKLNQNVIRDEI